MANDLNECSFIGRLGKPPELKYMPSGNAVAEFSIACGKSWTDKNTGQKQERTEWISCKAFGKLSEIIGKYLDKGSQVYISGELRTDSWDDKQTGEKKYRTNIIVSNMQMLGGKSNNQGQQTQQPAQNNQQAATGGADFEDDVPFAPFMKGMVV